MMYEKPTLEIIRFQTEDIVTQSKEKTVGDVWINDFSLPDLSL